MTANVIEHQIVEKLGLFPSVAPFIGKLTKTREGSSVADGNYVFSIGELFVVLVAPPQFPRVVADEVAKINLAKSRLSSPDKIIDVVVSGELDSGQSFAVFPKGKPVSDNRLLRAWQKRRLGPSALEWLRSIASDASPTTPAATAEFKESLAALITVPGLSPKVVDKAQRSLGLLEQEPARFCPMHSDMWTGNLILLPGGDFRVIDWRGFRPNGYGFFDLVKLCQSLGLGADFRGELDAHEKILGTHDAGAVAAMLAACGHIYRNLDQFPLPRFIEMTESMFGYLRRAMT